MIVNTPDIQNNYVRLSLFMYVMYSNSHDKNNSFEFYVAVKNMELNGNWHHQNKDGEDGNTWAVCMSRTLPTAHKLSFEFVQSATNVCWHLLFTSPP